MLATIPLLGKPSDQALMDIISYHNGMRLELNKVIVGEPVAVSGRRTRVTISAKPSTPYRDNNYIQSMNFTYNRLNLHEVFFQHIFQGIELEAPVTTEKVVTYLKTFLPFIHEEWEFLPNTIFSSSESFVLTAHPNSLRWQGSITIPLTIVTDINDLLIQDFLNGIENRDIHSSIVPFIHTAILKGLNYMPMLPSLVTTIQKDILNGLKTIDLMTHISTAFQSKFLPGHWIEDEGEIVITSDTSKPGIGALNDLIDTGSSVPSLVHEIVSVSELHPGWPDKGKVVIKGVSGSGFVGSTTLYFNKINIEDIAPGGTVLVDQMEDIGLALSQINSSLNTSISNDQVNFINIDVHNGVWKMVFQNDDPLFYGELIVNDASLSIQMFVSGLIQIADTDYYKFKEVVSYSPGSEEFNTPVSITNPYLYRAYWSGNMIKVDRLSSGNVWWLVYEIPLATNPDHISLTFDALGKVTVSYQLGSQLYIYYYDHTDVSYKTLNFSTGRAPFVALNTFNEHLSVEQQVFLMYVNSDNVLCYRAQNDDYSIEYEIESDVVDIMTIGRTAFDSLKIEFMRTIGAGSYEFDNIATEQNGFWVYDPLGNEIELTIEDASISDEEE